MKYKFHSCPEQFATHKRISDDSFGILESYSDDVILHPPSEMLNFVDENLFELIQPEIIPVEEPIIEEQLVIIPDEIENWRARTILEIDGVLAVVDELIQNLQGTEGIVVRNAWQGRAPISRQSQTVQTLASQLNLTAEQMDNMFIRAAALTI